MVVISSDGQARDYTLLFNPTITASAPERSKGEEGSVSLPGVRVAVERATWVEVSFQDELGAAKVTKFDGFAARVAAHEIDQMNGVFFLDRVSRLKRDMALKKARKQPG